MKLLTLDQFIAEFNEWKSSSLEKEIKSLYKNILEKFTLFEDKDNIEINLIKIKQQFQNKGYFKEICKKIFEYANKVKKTVTIWPDEVKNGISPIILKQIYKGIGFKEHPTKENPDEMIWYYEK